MELTLPYPYKLFQMVRGKEKLETEKGRI